MRSGYVIVRGGLRQFLSEREPDPLGTRRGETANACYVAATGTRSRCRTLRARVRHRCDVGHRWSNSNADPFDVALSYLDKNATDLGVTGADVADVAVTSQFRSSHNGVTHVNLNQRLEGLEVFGAHVTVNVASDGRVIFAGGSLVPLSAPSGGVSLKATDAVVAAADALDLGETSDVRVISEEGGAAQATVVSGSGVSAGPIGARLGWQPTAGGLRKAWQMVIDHSSSASLWNATIDAETGRCWRPTTGPTTTTSTT